MPRNKYPEQTVEKILEAAVRLFMQKGYEQTTLQDIIAATGLSKGALYHHFSSKEAIWNKVKEQIAAQNIEPVRAIRDDPGLNGLQKLQAVFHSALRNENQDAMMHLMPGIAENPRFWGEELRDILRETAPVYVAPMIRQGIEDGSIRAEDPEALAEAVMLLANLWLHPLGTSAAPEQTRARARVFRRITDAVGLPLLTDEDEELLSRLCGN